MAGEKQACKQAQGIREHGWSYLALKNLSLEHGANARLLRCAWNRPKADYCFGRKRPQVPQAQVTSN